MSKRKLTEAEEKDEAIFNQIKELFDKEHENSRQALTEAGYDFQTDKNDTPGNILTSAFKQGIQEFGSLEAFEAHIDHLTDEYEKLISQTSLAESYFESERIAKETMKNDPYCNPNINFAYVGRKPIRME